MAAFDLDRAKQFTPFQEKGGTILFLMLSGDDVCSYTGLSD